MSDSTYSEQLKEDGNRRILPSSFVSDIVAMEKLQLADICLQQTLLKEAYHAQSAALRSNEGLNLIEPSEASTQRSSYCYNSLT